MRKCSHRGSFACTVIIYMSRPTAVLSSKDVQNHRNYIFVRAQMALCPVFTVSVSSKLRIQLADLAQITMDQDPITKFQGITFLGGSRWFMVRLVTFSDAQPACPLTNRKLNLHATCIQSGWCDLPTDRPKQPIVEFALLRRRQVGLVSGFCLLDRRCMQLDVWLCASTSNRGGDPGCPRPNVDWA